MDLIREFDENFYLRMYPDIISNGYIHFLQFGRYENRRMNALVFDEAYYLQENPDVVESMAITGKPISGYLHYITCGFEENRRHKWDKPPVVKYDFNNNNNIKWIITASPYDSCKGGIVALHKLATFLKQVGEDAYLWLLNLSSPTPNFDSPNPFLLPIANEAVDPRNNIVIYPEVVTNNFLSSQYVVRWLLHKPNYFNNAPLEWEENDFIASYSPECKKNYPNAFDLCVLELWESKLKYSKTTERCGTCYTLRKSYDKIKRNELGELELPYSGVEIPYSGYSLDYLLILFSNKEVFYSYDSKTALSLFAAMCGCVSIVIPNDNVSKEEWHEFNPLFKYGIAYGVEDIKWATDTSHMVLPYLLAQKEESIKTVAAFAAKVKQHFGL